MNIGQPLRDLGAVESQSLREAILALEEPVWQEEQLRQKKYSDVHYNTESVILIFCDHDNWKKLSSYFEILPLFVRSLFTILQQNLIAAK